MFESRAIKALPKGEHLTSPDFPGLRIVSSSAGFSWIYRFKNDEGKMRQVKIGGWPAISAHAAIAEWEKLRQQRGIGIDPAFIRQVGRDEKAAQRASQAAESASKLMTVAAVCDAYQKGYIRFSRQKKGADEVERMFSKMLGDLAGAPAASVTRAQAFELIQSLAENAPYQARKLKTELAAAWDRAIDSGNLPEETPNWWRRVLKGKIRSRGKKQGGVPVGMVKRVLTQDEAGSLIRWLPNFTAVVEDCLVVYLWTCTRGGEICGMTGAEVRREPDGVLWWTIPKQRTKNVHRENAMDCRVPLFGRAEDVVLRRVELYGDGPLFPSRKNPAKSIEQKSISVAVYTHQPYCTTKPEYARPRLTVTNWSPHDLRRTSRTFLASIGCPDEVGEAILGHSPPGIVGVYNRHTYDAERVAWLKKLDELLRRLSGRS